MDQTFSAARSGVCCKNVKALSLVIDSAEDHQSLLEAKNQLSLILQEKLDSKRQRLTATQPV